MQSIYNIERFIEGEYINVILLASVTAVTVSVKFCFILLNHPNPHCSHKPYQYKI